MNKPTKPNYYTPGNPKRKRAITREWFEKCLVKAFTQDDIIAKIRSLPDTEVVRLYRDWLPKEIKQVGDQGVRVTFIMNGIEESRTIQGEVIRPALTDGDDD